MAFTTIDRLERGDKNPSAENLYRLAHAFGLNLLDYFGQTTHAWERFYPEDGYTVAKCGAELPYGDDKVIVLWAEKPLTCLACRRIVEASATA